MWSASITGALGDCQKCSHECTRDLLNGRGTLRLSRVPVLAFARRQPRTNLPRKNNEGEYTQ